MKTLLTRITRNNKNQNNKNQNNIIQNNNKILISINEKLKIP